MSFAKRTLGSDNASKQELALGALQSLLTDTQYGNLPLIFDLLAGSLESAGRHLRPGFAELLTLLARRSPQETEYFLQNQLAEHPGEGTKWIVRQAMKALPEDSRARLRRAMEA